MIEYTSICISKIQWDTNKKSLKEFIERKLAFGKIQEKGIINLGEYGLDAGEVEYIKSGIWESKECAIKIIVLKSEYIVLIYKDLDNARDRQFYTEFVKICRDMGALVVKIVDGDVIFKDKLNVELLKNLKDIKGENNMKIENFKRKIDLLNGCWNRNFINKWIKCLSLILLV